MMRICVSLSDDDVLKLRNGIVSDRLAELCEQIDLWDIWSKIQERKPVSSVETIADEWTERINSMVTSFRSRVKPKLQIRKRESRITWSSKHRTQAHLQMECLGDEYGSQSDKATKVTSGSLRKMLDDQDYRCAITGIKLTPRSAVLDHIQPLSKGGDHALSNVHIVDVRINSGSSPAQLDRLVLRLFAVVLQIETIE